MSFPTLGSLDRFNVGPANVEAVSELLFAKACPLKKHETGMPSRFRIAIFLLQVKKGHLYVDVVSLGPLRPDTKWMFSM